MSERIAPQYELDTPLTREALLAYLAEQGYPDETREQINGWIDRGDGVAIYRNEDFGSPELGHTKLVSFGSPAAQLEVDEPPARLPDIGAAINWRYCLRGTYRGERL